MIIKLTSSQAEQFVQQWLEDNAMSQILETQKPRIFSDDFGEQFWRIDLKLVSVAYKPYISKIVIPVKLAIDADCPTSNSLRHTIKEITEGYDSNLFDTFN